MNDYDYDYHPCFDFVNNLGFQFNFVNQINFGYGFFGIFSQITEKCVFLFFNFLMLCHWLASQRDSAHGKKKKSQQV